MVIPVVVVTLLASALAGWTLLAILNPLARVVMVDVASACSPAMQQWGDSWRSPRAGGADVGRLSVICRPDGTPYAAVARVRAADGQAIGTWRTAPTFFHALPASGSERVDVFDTGGQLRWYATVDRGGRRVEFYDAQSRFAGYGTFDPASGVVERVESGRTGRTTTLPIPPPFGADALAAR